MRMARLLLTVVFIAAFAAAAPAQTVTLLCTADAGYAGEGDANNGKYGYMNADLGFGMRRLVVQWDLSSIPLGARIRSAQVNIFRLDSTDGKPFSAYRITSRWSEGHGMGNGSYPAGMTPDGVSWIHRLKENQTTWRTPGGDYDPDSRVSFTGAGVRDPVTGVNFGMQPNIKDIVQSWVSGVSSNFGIIIISEETVYQRHAMLTRDNGYPDNGEDRPTPGRYAPQLVVEYELVKTGLLLQCR